MGRGMQETNERSRQESGNVGSIVPSPARFCKGREGGCYKHIGKGRQDGVRKVSPDGRLDSRLDLQCQSPAFWHWALQVQRPATSSSPPLPSPPQDVWRSKGQKWKPQKTVCVTFLSLPRRPSFIFSRPSTFHHPLFRPCPCPSSRLVYIGEARSLLFWFRAQMALACLWQRIKPPVSPFASMCKRSGQRTSNRRRKKKGGGRNAREGEGEREEEGVREKGKKKKNLRLSVKQHSALMFHGIPGRVNSNSCKNSQPAFTFAGFFFFFLFVFRLHQPLHESGCNFCRVSVCLEVLSHATQAVCRVVEGGERSELLTTFCSIYM